MIVHSLPLSRFQSNEGTWRLAVQEQGPKIRSSYFRLHGLDGWAVAASALAEEQGKQWALVAIVAAESFPQGELEGVVAHWGVAGVQKKGGWEQPPTGWTSDPETSQSQGSTKGIKCPADISAMSAKTRHPSEPLLLQ